MIVFHWFSIWSYLLVLSSFSFFFSHVRTWPIDVLIMSMKMLVLSLSLSIFVWVCGLVFIWTIRNDFASFSLSFYSSSKKVFGILLCYFLVSFTRTHTHLHSWHKLDLSTDDYLLIKVNFIIESNWIELNLLIHLVVRRRRKCFIIVSFTFPSISRSFVVVVVVVVIIVFSSELI